MIDVLATTAVIASAFGDIAALLGLWAFCGFFFGGVASAVALAHGARGAQIASDGAKGAAAGFIIGFFVTVGAALYVAFG